MTLLTVTIADIPLTRCPLRQEFRLDRETAELILKIAEAFQEVELSPEHGQIKERGVTLAVELGGTQMEVNIKVPTPPQEGASMPKKVTYAKPVSWERDQNVTTAADF